MAQPRFKCWRGSESDEARIEGEVREEPVWGAPLQNFVGILNFKWCSGSAPAYLADYCTSTSLVPGRSALKSAAHGDIVVPSHRTDWGLRSFAVAGPSSWNALPVDLRSSSSGLDTCAKHLKTHLLGSAYSRQSTHF